MALDQIDVLIIGAGASGIAALRQLSLTSLTLRCVDARSGVGGVWNYEPDPGPCAITFDSQAHPHVSTPPISTTPIYHGLRTNVPTELMAFHRSPFDPGPSAFPVHPVVLDYLHRSATELEQYLELETQVKRVCHRPPDHPTTRKWMVEIHQLLLGQSKVLYCDYVIAANGHNSQAYIPPIPGLISFPNQLLHSLFYRTPTDPTYHSKTIAVVGLGPSGYDILRELATLPPQTRPNLYALSDHPPKIGWDLSDPCAPAWTRNITCCPALSTVSGPVLTLSDKSTISGIDLILFATGYSYAFPFANIHDLPWSKNPLTITGRRVHNIDTLQTFYFPDPSFAFLALNTAIVPFPLAEHQARAIAAKWSNRADFKIYPFEDHTTESSIVHQLPPPQEYDRENELLELAGEGSSGKGWALVEESKIRCRLEADKRHKDELGY